MRCADAADRTCSRPTPAITWRSSHDLARRIATGTTVPADDLSSAVQGATTLETLQALFFADRVGPGTTPVAEWFAAHLYPFVGELVHYDVVERGAATDRRSSGTCSGTLEASHTTYFAPTRSRSDASGCETDC